RVKPKTPVVQIARAARGVERGEQNPKPSGMPCIDPPRVSRAEKSAQTLVPNSRDHPVIVTYRLSHFQLCSTDATADAEHRLDEPPADSANGRRPRAGCSRRH